MWIHNALLAAVVILFAYLQYRDVVTTNAFLTGKRSYEANPVMAFTQKELGKWWWTPKLVYVAAIAAAAIYSAVIGKQWFAAVPLAMLDVFWP